MTDLAMDTATPAAAPDTSEPAPVKDGKIPQGIDDRSEEARAETELNDDLRKIYRKNDKSEAKAAIRDRGEDGKFKPAPAANAETSSDEAKAAEPAKDAKPVKAEAQPDTKPADDKPKPTVEAPGHWPKEAREKFAALPAEVQKEVADLTLADRKALSRLGEANKVMEPVRQVLQKHNGYLGAVSQATGMSPTQFLDYAVSVSQRLDSNPESVIRELASKYNVKLSNDPVAEAFADPEVESLKATVNRLEQQLNNRAAQEQWHAEQARQSQLSALERSIDDFSADKPDFENLQTEIFANVAALRQSKPDAAPADILKAAYDAARWANPTTRAKLISEQQAAAEVERTERAKKEAEASRRAASINVSSRPQQAYVGNLDDDLRAIFRKHNS